MEKDFNPKKSAVVYDKIKISNPVPLKYKLKIKKYDSNNIDIEVIEYRI